jgi:uncharacterized membrane protein YqjE
MAENPRGTGKGLFHSVAVLATTLVAIAHNRLDLLSTDIEEYRAHLLSLLLWSLTALFCLAVGILLAIILLVVAFWDTHRLWVLCTLTGLFLVGGAGIFWFSLHKAKTMPRLFETSLLELLKDRQQLDRRP